MLVTYNEFHCTYCEHAYSIAVYYVAENVSLTDDVSIKYLKEY